MIPPTVPRSLRHWFIAHFIIDVLFAVPLLFFTFWFLNALNFSNQNLIFVRLVGAALIAVGGTSWAMRKDTVESYKTMLILKLLWSGAAIIAISISLYGRATGIVWVFLAIFSLFFIVWSYYLLLLTKHYGKNV